MDGCTLEQTEPHRLCKSYLQLCLEELDLEQKESVSICSNIFLLILINTLPIVLTSTLQTHRNTRKTMCLVVLKRYKAEILTGHVGKHHSNKH